MLLATWYRRIRTCSYSICMVCFFKLHTDICVHNYLFRHLSNQILCFNSLHSEFALPGTQYLLKCLVNISNTGSIVSLLREYILSFHLFSTNTKPHLTRGLKLCDIMLCSWFNSSDISVTVFGSFLKSSRIASLFGFDRVVKNILHESLTPFFISKPR